MCPFSSVGVVPLAVSAISVHRDVFASDFMISAGRLTHAMDGAPCVLTLSLGDCGRIGCPAALTFMSRS